MALPAFVTMSPNPILWELLPLWGGKVISEDGHPQGPGGELGTAQSAVRVLTHSVIHSFTHRPQGCGPGRGGAGETACPWSEVAATWLP